MKNENLQIFFLSVLLVLTLSSCRASGPDESASGSAPAAAASKVSMNKDDYAVFPNADAGVDPSVSADQGGKGFQGEGWETNTSFDLIGDPRAVKGGTLRDFILDFPGTLRMYGPEANTQSNFQILQLVYETLVGTDPTTLNYIPSLATHWQISPDKMTFRFRIDPNARFSDGTPVASEDVVASWTFLTDKTLQDPFFNSEYAKLEKPVAESKYIVRIKAKKLSWQNFDLASGMRIMPARVLKNMDGAAYLRDYNFKLVPGSGPYIVNESDVEKGKSVTIRRRNDYWAEKYRASVGLYNFAELRSTVVRDPNLAWEMFKKGDLDYFYVNRSKVWVEQTNDEKFRQGHIGKVKVFNNYPAALQFMAFNTRRKPWDDVRVRKAFTLLFNREQMIQKLFYNEYLPINSFFPGTPYENPNNPKNLFDPQEALRLLADAGWKDHDAQGRLVKNGQPLNVDLLYRDKTSETYLTVYQDDLRKVGITLNLQFVTPETLWKMEMQRQFDLVAAGWVVGSVFPTPTPEFTSKFADEPNSNNISGFKNKKVDEICAEYDVTFDPKKRTELLRELDSLLTNEYHYIMEWYGPYRVAYWNKFGMPKGTFSRLGDYVGSLAPGIPQLWWIDSGKQSKLEQGLRNPSLKLEVGPTEDRYWLEYSKSAQAQSKPQGSSN